jgi:hypothetical protein
VVCGVHCIFIFIDCWFLKNRSVFWYISFFSLSFQDREHDLARVTIEWREARLAHLKAVLDWLSKACLQDIVEDGVPYFLEQTIVSTMPAAAEVTLGKV